MKRFKNILVVGGQAEANRFLLERAVILAQENGGRLTVVEAVSGLPHNMPTSVWGASPKELNEHFAQERQKELVQQVLPKVGDGTPHDVAVLVGKPFVEIIKAVLRHKHDLVMMTAKGYRGFRGRLFGSTALHLMRKCPCPVWIMNPPHQKRFSGILAAVDPDPRDEPKHMLNIKIMELATSLAQQEQSKLHVVHVWAPWREPFSLVTPPYQITRLIKWLKNFRPSVAENLTNWSEYIHCMIWTARFIFWRTILITPSQTWQPR